MLEYAVGVLSEAAVVRTPRRLHVSHAPRLWPQHAEECFGVRRSRPHLKIERLLNDAPLRRPECRQLQNEVLEGHERFISFSTLMDSGSRPRVHAVKLGLGPC